MPLFNVFHEGNHKGLPLRTVVKCRGNPSVLAFQCDGRRMCTTFSLIGGNLTKAHLNPFLAALIFGLGKQRAC